MSNYQNQGKFKAQGKRYNATPNDYDRDYQSHSYSKQQQYHGSNGSGQDQRPRDGYAKNQ